MYSLQLCKVKTIFILTLMLVEPALVVHLNVMKLSLFAVQWHVINPNLLFIMF